MILISSSAHDSVDSEDNHLLETYLRRKRSDNSKVDRNSYDFYVLGEIEDTFASNQVEMVATPSQDV